MLNENKNQNTIVSCFISNMNNRNDRSVNKYIEYGLKLLNVDIPKIIFMDEETISILNDNYNKNQYTYIIPFKREDIYLNLYKGKITDFNLKSDFPEKDTIDYMVLVCNKTEFMKKAISINTFNTENFVWVDFGINHIFNCSDELFKEKIETIRNKECNENKVRIGSIIYPANIPKNKDIYKEILWHFAGGVFGGNKSALLEFAELTKCKCLKVISEKKTIMWEVNIWHLVFLDNPELFSSYYCDHNETLITKY